VGLRDLQPEPRPTTRYGRSPQLATQPEHWASSFAGMVRDPWSCSAGLHARLFVARQDEGRSPRPNTLVGAFATLAVALHPDVVVMENVPDLVSDRWVVSILRPFVMSGAAGYLCPRSNPEPLLSLESSGTLQACASGQSCRTSNLSSLSNVGRQQSTQQ